MQSMTWTHVLNLPSFVVNMTECSERLALTQDRLSKAGFTQLHRWDAVDARDPVQLGNGWNMVGNPAFAKTDAEFIEYKGKQGCFLSHILLWQHIIDNGIEIANVFEDDVCFHNQWHELAHKYWEATPRDWDVLYMGSQIDYMMPSHILRTPVFCTHAYVITLEGARKCLSATLGDPDGVRTIDCMLIDAMKADLMGVKPCPFNWYAWNGTLFADPAAFTKWEKRNSGLVFQDIELGTYVREWQ